MKFLRLFFAALLLVPAWTWAQSWPDRPIRIVVPFPPGGGVDNLARIIAKDLAPRLGATIVVDNVGGANGAIGAQQVARAAADGYTLMLMSDGGIVASPAINPNLPYSPLKDFIPVAMISRSESVIVAKPTLPVKNLADVIELARKNPEGLSYGSAGIGNFTHLAMEMLQAESGIKLLHVPYKGTGPALQGLMSNDVDLLYTNIAPVEPAIRANKVKPIAFAGQKRSPIAPDVALITDTVPSFSYSSWSALFAPAGTPSAIVDKLSKTVHEYLQDPSTIKFFNERQTNLSYMNSSELTNYIRGEQAKWAVIVTKQDIKID